MDYACVIYTEAWLLRDGMETLSWVTLGWGCDRLRVKEYAACDNKTYASSLDKNIRRDDGLKRDRTKAQCHG